MKDPETASAREERAKRIADMVRGIQGGNPEPLKELWEEMKPVCRWLCRRLYRQFSKSFMLEYGDLYNCGYIALCEAVKHIKPEMSENMPRYYMYYLTAVVYRENGLKKGGRDENGKRRFDPAISELTVRLDAGTDENGERTSDFFDFITGFRFAPDDDSGWCSLKSVERRIFLRQLHDALETTIGKLPRNERILIRRKYYAGESNAQIATRLRITPSEAARLEDSALIRLRKYGKTVGLEEFLESRTNYCVGADSDNCGNSGARFAERLARKRTELKEKCRWALSGDNGERL